MSSSFFHNKHVLVFGLGVLGGGEGVVRTVVALGGMVRVTDAKTAQQLDASLSKLQDVDVEKYTLGGHDSSDIEWADIIIKNPAVPSDHPLIQQAFALGKHVTTEAALYLKLTSAFTIGITGTRGKTTTTMMIAAVLEKGLNRPVLIGGNIQERGCLPLLLEDSSEHVVVLELSSWALQGCHWEKVSPNVAVITNLYPDHLNRYHGSMQEYAYDKAAIVLYQRPDDQTFLQTQHEWFEYFRDAATGQIHLYDAVSLPENIHLKISGHHNRVNAAAAHAVGIALHIDRATIIDALEHFSGVAYRQQVVGENAKHRFINDSTSTTPAALHVALQTFPDATFIIGGTSKQLDLTGMVEDLKNFSGTCIFLRGSGTSELFAHPDFPQRWAKNQLFSTLAEAFEAACQMSARDIVFSPAFTSFELFDNEFDRAHQFDDLVKQALQA